MAGGLTITIEILGAQAMHAVLTADQYKARVGAGILEGVAYMERQIAQRMHKNTGQTAASVHWQRRGSDVYQAEVTSSSIVALILEDGSRPHIIRPKRAKVLAFHGGSGTVFTRFVRHPGTRGYHAFRDGAQASAQAVIEIIARRIGVA